MYLTISIIVAIISYYLFKRTGADMNPRGLNMLSWIYYVQFICFSLIGATCTVYGVDHHYVISTISYNNNIRFWGWVFVLYTMVAFPLSIIFIKISFNGHDFVERNIKVKSIVYRKPFVALFTLFSLFACLYPLYTAQYVGFIYIISGHVSAQEGISYSRNFTGNIYVKNIFAQLLSILTSMIWYIEWKITSEKKAMILFVIMMFFAILMLTQNNSKAPLIEYFISFIMLRIYLQGRISRKLFCALLILSCLGIILMYIKIAGLNISEIFSSYNSGVLCRIFFSQIAGLFKTLEYFPTLHDFIGFSSISRADSSLIGYEYMNRSARIVMSFFNTCGIEDGSAGVMNSLFIAEAWANYGIMGVVVSPWIVGLITGFVYYSTTNNRSLMYGAVYGYLSLRIPITGGFNDFIYPVGLAIPFVLTFVMTITIKRLNQKQTTYSAK